MSTQENIRDMYRRGESKSQIARTLGIDRKTVHKYLKMDDFSPKPPESKVSHSPLEQYWPVIDEWLESDRGVFYKQRHTASRIHARLVAEKGYQGSYPPVQRYVKMRKEQMRLVRPADEPLDLIWEPGSMQTDFGQADFDFNGKLTREHYLTNSYPHSNGGFTQVFGGETAECVCQGLKDTFEYVGCVPHLIVFDNATGVGRRIKDTVIETELFKRFKMHYGFEVRFCNPESGHEKGGVERKVAFHRKNLFVPVPVITDIKAFNTALFDKCLKLECREHYRKKVPIPDLLKEDIAASLPLPKKPFDVVRYVYPKTDGYGYVTLESSHVYSTSPAFACRNVVVALRAHTVTIADMDGAVIASHVRHFGKGRTESIDAASTVRFLAKKPGAWRNSRLRVQMPAAVVERMDALGKDALRADLELLAESMERNGVENTLDALDVLAREHAEFPDFFQVSVMAARIADFGLDTLPVPGADLGIYDERFLGLEVAR
jgi:transposase